MKLQRNLTHLFILGLATAWGLFLDYNHHWLRGYYIKGEAIHIQGVIYTCRFHYSPSPLFVLLVLIPAIVLLALYLHFRKPALWRGGVELGITTLTVLLVPLVNPWWAFKALILVSIGTGLIAGRGKAEKALLSTEGFVYGFLVLYLILGELAVSC